MLPATDIEFLDSLSNVYELCGEAGMICVVVKALVLPLGLAPASPDLLLRLQPGYPDIPPDMWWFSPAVTRTDRQPIPATNVTEQHLGRSWQRWSRHLQPGQWISGVDTLQTYFAILRQDLQKFVAVAA
jgi:hypothetical protein